MVRVSSCLQVEAKESSRGVMHEMIRRLHCCGTQEAGIFFARPKIESCRYNAATRKTIFWHVEDTHRLYV